MKRALLILALVVLWVGSGQLAQAEVGSIYRVGKDVVIEKEDRVRHILSVGGQVTISGKAEGNVLSVFDSIVLTETAVIYGDLVSIGGVVVQARGSVVKGSVSEINFAQLSDSIAMVLTEQWEGWSWVFALISMFLLLCLLVLGVIAYAILPRHMNVISEEVVKAPLKVTFWGVIGLVSIVPMAVLLTMSVVGIVLVPLQMTIAGGAMVLGFIAVSQQVGRGVLLLLRRRDQRGLTQASLGLVIIWIVGWVPMVGTMLKAIIIVVGLGSVLLTRFGTTKS